MNIMAGTCQEYSFSFLPVVSREVWWSSSCEQTICKYRSLPLFTKSLTIMHRDLNQSFPFSFCLDILFFYHNVTDSFCFDVGSLVKTKSSMWFILLTTCFVNFYDVGLADWYVTMCGWYANSPRATRFHDKFYSIPSFYGRLLMQGKTPNVMWLVHYQWTLPKITYNEHMSACNLFNSPKPYMQMVLFC